MLASNKNKGTDDELNIYRNVKPHYSRTQQDIWNNIDGKINIEQEVAKQIPVFQIIFRYVAAAVIILLLGTGFMKFYTKEVSTRQKGKNP